MLVIAGSDSGGGAGIQADIKTVTALGGYAATAITALTAQNTRGVFGVVGVDPGFVAEQISVVLTDIGADAIKTGMLHSAEIVSAVAACLEARARSIPLIVDPVMIAKGGSPLLSENARIALVERLLPIAALITPNAPEAEVLSGVKIDRVSDMERAADRLLAFGASAVLVKGAHLDGDLIVDLLRTADGEEARFEHPRQNTRSTHGTGCTLSSAIATGIGLGFTLRDAVKRAEQYLLEAIRTAPGFGSGYGPLNHGHPLGARLN
ncbi:MAG TPA: bifunctional hydroxymethylpyrimidine kinase/phosphomethylpyrimidine kinase [Polyangiaceae bacterium]